MSKHPITDFLKTASEALPSSIADARDELKRQITPLIQQQLLQLDLVSRKELENQQQVIEALHTKIAELEKELERLSPS